MPDFGGYAVTSEQEAEKHIKAVVDLLNTYPKYQIALLDDKALKTLEKANILDPFLTWWEVKVGHVVFMEALRGDAEVDLEITEPTLVQGFSEYFLAIWNSLPEDCKNHDKVVKRLIELIGDSR